LTGTADGDDGQGGEFPEIPLYNDVLDWWNTGSSSWEWWKEELPDITYAQTMLPTYEEACADALPAE
jgi:uncharacterized protein (DUF924 family)